MKGFKHTQKLLESSPSVVTGQDSSPEYKSVRHTTQHTTLANVPNPVIKDSLQMYRHQAAFILPPFVLIIQHFNRDFKGNSQNILDQSSPTWKRDPGKRKKQSAKVKGSQAKS
ncbi:hypothetical protein J6590_083574 [Homalodisca vitripennis]|nr:hypothetical protein J6590_083574 [Homalodisca vitripennis]